MTSNRYPVTSQVSCLRRLCLAASCCRVDALCNDEFCGPFALPWRQVNVLMPSATKQDFQACAKDMACAAETIWRILGSEDCDRDGDIDCDDKACSLNNILNPKASLQNETHGQYQRSGFMARYWKISYDTYGEPVQLMSGSLLSCVHNLVFGRQWSKYPVRSDTYETIDLAYGFAIIPKLRIRADFIDWFLETLNVKSVMLRPTRESKTYVDDALQGDNLDRLRGIPEKEKEFKLLTMMKFIDKIEEFVETLENATEKVGLNSTTDTDILLNLTRDADEVLEENRKVSIPKIEEVLDKLETLWGRAKLPENGTRQQVEKMLAAGAVSIHNSRGITLNCSQGCQSLNDSQIHMIGLLDDSSLEEVETGALLPKHMPVTDIHHFTLVTYGNTTAFSFGENGTVKFEDKEWRPNSFVVSFSVWSENGTKLQLPPGQHVNISFRNRYFTTTDVAPSKICVSRENSTGNWTKKNCELLRGTKVDICKCHHLTHFALLIDVTEREVGSYALEIISIVGCTLSLIGIFGIVLIATLAPEWRQESENKVLLNLTTAIALMMVAFLVATFSSKLQRHNSSCVVLGAVMHFGVLASFLWSLAAAITHYLRFTKVDGPSRVSWLALKSGLVAWGLPSVCVAVVVSQWPESYNRGLTEQGLCYPKGPVLFITVLGPIALTLTVNLIIFILILRTIGLLPCLNKDHLNMEASAQRTATAKRRLMIRKVLVCVAFIFLFGLTWLLGIYSFSVVCSYFFCATASLQGVVLFVFFAMGARKAREEIDRRFRRTAIARALQGQMAKGRFTPLAAGSGGSSSTSTTVPNAATSSSVSGETKTAPPAVSTKLGQFNSSAQTSL